MNLELFDCFFLEHQEGEGFQCQIRNLLNNKVCSSFRIGYVFTTPHINFMQVILN